MAIALAMKQSNMRAMMDNGPSPSSQLAQFIRQSFAQGKQAADDLQNIQLHRQSDTSSINQSLIQDIFWDSSSEYVTRMAGSVPSNVIELLHHHLPKGTKLVLPAGLPFDARAVTSNSNFHANNNRLTNVSSNDESAPHPGMVDKYRPDYSKPNDVFEQAAVNPNTISNVVASIGNEFYKTSPLTKDELHTLDNDLARELRSAAAIPKTTSLFDVLLVYPFDLAKLDNVNRTKYDMVSENLIELNGDNLGVSGDIGGIGIKEDRAYAAPGRKAFITLRRDDVNRLKPGIYLNDSLVDFWMRWITRSMPNGKDAKMHTFTTQFMSTLRDNGLDAVKSWTAKKSINVFQKSMIFFPIHESDHWSLMIAINPGNIAMNFSEELKNEGAL